MDKENNLQVKLDALGGGEEQLIHLLFPLKHNRPGYVSNGAKVPLFRAFLSLVKLHLSSLFGTSFQVFDLGKMQKACVLILSDTVNQHQALAPVEQSLKKMNERVSWCEEKRMFRSSSHFSQAKIFIQAFWKIRRYSFLRNAGSHGVAKVYFFLSEMAYYRTKLEETEPQSILISNDHNPSMMAIQYAAHLVGVPVDYVQHAHVTSIFPEPLYLRNIFSDGKVSSQIYEGLTPRNCIAQTYSFGPVRFEQQYLNMLADDNSVERRLIGLALDFECSILCERGLTNISMIPEKEINIRFHPRTNSKKKLEIQETLHAAGLKLRVFNESSPDGFLRNSEIIFGGESSIILDAALFNCVPVCLSKQKEDYYGFIKAGLAYHTSIFPRNLDKFIRDECGNIRQKALCEFISDSFLSGEKQRPSELIAQTIVDSNMQL